MNITEFFSLDGRKLLITERVKNGNRLRRIYDRSNQDKGDATAFVQTKTPVQIARELVSVDRAIKGVEPLTFINSQAGSVLLDSLLKDKPLSFVPDRSSGLETSKEIYRVLKEIRMGFVSDPDEDRVAELLKLSEVFEKELSDRVLCDDALCLKLAIDLLDSPDLNIGFALPWITGSKVGSLETDRFRYLEKEFIAKLVEKCGLTYEPAVKYLPEESDASYESHFFKAYGLFNEVSYVADKIENGDTKYGDYTIYYMHEDYVNFLRMIFQRRGIPITFSSGIRCSTTNTVQFMLAALDFFEQDFSYNALKQIAYNPILRNVKDGDGSNIKFNSVSCYRTASRGGIGWGKERYKDYLNRLLAEPKAVEEDKRKRQEEMILFAQFMADLVAVADNPSVGDLYSSLLEFTWNTLAAKNQEKKLIKSILFAQRDVFNCIEDKLDLNEKCQLIRDSLLAMKYTEDEATDKVNAVLLSDLEVVERKSIFLIGLSARYVKVSSSESPVASDDLLKKCLDCSKGYVCLSGNKNKERRECMDDTLRSGKAADITFGYSYFDTVELRDNSSSVFFIERLGDGEPDEYEYEKHENGFKWDKDVYIKYINGLNDACDDEQESKAETVAEKTESTEETETSEENTYEISMSSTGLQELVACPLKYYYHHVKRIPADEEIDREPFQWLSPVKRGNLFHYFLDKYVDQKLPKNASDVLEEFDEACFNACFDEAVERVLTEIPYPSKDVFDIEKEELREIGKSYILNIHDFWKSEADAGRKWINLGCEADFEKVKINDIRVSTEEKEIPVGLFFTGAIDRWDCYLDDESTLHVKITDYKTGDLEKLQTKIGINTQLQHYIYAYAAYHLLIENWEELCRRFSGKEIKRVHIDNIRYEFPLEADNPDGYIEAIDSVSIDASDPEKMKPAANLEIMNSKPANVVFDPVSKLPDTVINVFVNSEGKRLIGDNNTASTWMKDYVQRRMASSDYKDRFNQLSNKEVFCKYCNYCGICRMYL